jgi:SAM-dependent methyltransferase
MKQEEASSFASAERLRIAIGDGFLPVKGSRILEVGHGNGTFLATCVAHGLQATGIDMSLTACKNAHSRIGVGCVRGDVELGLPFPSSTFSAVFMYDVIEHFENPVFVLREIHRVLIAQGRVFVGTLNAASPLRLIKGENWFPYSDPTHIILFTPFTLKFLLEKTHFRCDSLSTCNIGRPVTSAVLAPLGWASELYAAATRV